MSPHQPAAPVHVSKTIYGGSGIATLASGKKVIVEGTVEGDQVGIHITREKKKLAFAEPVTTPVNPRIRSEKPPCRWYGECGGCHWQGIPYDHQIAWKKSFVADSLERIGGLTKPKITAHLAPQPLGYRNRLTTTWQIKNRTAQPLMHRPRSFEMIAVPDCLQLVSSIRKVIRELGKLSWPIPDGTFDLTLIAARNGRVYSQLRNSADEVDNFLNSVSGSPAVPNLHHNSPGMISWDQQDQVDFYSQVAGFQQAHHEQNQAMRTLILNLLDKRRPQKIFDLYAGNGNLSLLLGARNIAVTGIEISQTSVDAANHAAKALGPDIVYHTGDISDMLTALREANNTTAVILNPPRSGASEVTHYLANCDAGTIIYVSCNPTTLARDLKQMSQRFQVIETHVFDLMPSTYHVETVAYLERRVDS